MDFLKSAVASAISKEPPFPYKFGDKVHLDQSFWTLYNGIKREDGSDCSIFAFDAAINSSRLPLARNAVRKLRTLRHPGVVRILDTVETDAYIYIATERVVPLAGSAQRKSLSEQTSKWGLYTITNTLIFVNDEASSVHGNVRLSSIFISQSGEWRLGGFESLSSMKDDDAVIYRHGSMLSNAAAYTPPEVREAGWEVIKRHPATAADAYGFATLVFEVFNGCFISTDQIGTTKNIPPSMHQSYKRLSNSNPKARLSVRHFKDQGRRTGSFFDSHLINLSEGIDSLGLKNDAEREDFLLELDGVADDFPSTFFSVKVLPELLKSLEFGGGGPRVFASVMKIAKNLGEDDWESRLIPAIVRLFANPDRAIRVCLLDNLPNMIDHLPAKIVNDKIFPQMATGFTDAVPVVREQTVKAVLTITPKLADRTINGELLKLLAKVANDEQPGIRTNTTICMGKIARYLGPHTRQKVLVAAFSRSLRDPFVHARHAALLALAATADLFADEDCASKVLPAICPSLVDKERLVRDQAAKAMEIYLQKIRKFASGLADTALPAAVSANGDTPHIGTVQNDSSGWAGWAISSFTNKLGGATGAMQTKTPSATPHLNPTERSSSVPAIVHKSQVPQPSPMAGGLTTATLSSSRSERASSSKAPSDIEDFADEEAENAWDDFNEEPSLSLGTESGQQSSTLTTTSVAFDDGGEPDFEGWLNAQAQSKTKPKGALPKGLSRPSTQSAGRGIVTRTATTGSVDTAVSARKLAVTTSVPKPASKLINTRAAEDDEGWGDAWD